MWFTVVGLGVQQTESSPRELSGSRGGVTSQTFTHAVAETKAIKDACRHAPGDVVAVVRLTGVQQSQTYSCWRQRKSKRTELARAPGDVVAVVRAGVQRTESSLSAQ
jgi:hypothetical protein